MTLLPLILTDSNGFAMSAMQLGQVYMGMSFIQIVGNLLFAKAIDKVGKPPAIISGCMLLSVAMASLGYCSNRTQLAISLGLWNGPLDNLLMVILGKILCACKELLLLSIS